MLIASIMIYQQTLGDGGRVGGTVFDDVTGQLKRGGGYGQRGTASNAYLQSHFWILCNCGSRRVKTHIEDFLRDPGTARHNTKCV